MVIAAQPRAAALIGGGGRLRRRNEHVPAVFPPGNQQTAGCGKPNSRCKGPTEQPGSSGAGDARGQA